LQAGRVWGFCSFLEYAGIERRRGFDIKVTADFDCFFVNCFGAQRADRQIAVDWSTHGSSGCVFVSWPLYQAAGCWHMGIASEAGFCKVACQHRVPASQVARSRPALCTRTTSFWNLGHLSHQATRRVMIPTQQKIHSATSAAAQQLLVHFRSHDRTPRFLAHHTTPSHRSKPQSPWQLLFRLLAQLQSQTWQSS